MKKDGFSILELAIVLVVIGLVTGGIIQGVSLMENAELKRVATDFSDIRRATQLFYDKYGYYPGDFPNATQIWGRADGGAPLTDNCANPDTDIDPNDPMATCNGNGDNKIANSADIVLNNTETYRLWQHLSNAQLISGQYSGVGGTLTGSWRVAVPDENVMKAPIKNGGFFIQSAPLDGFCGAGKWVGVKASVLQLLITLGKTTASWPDGRILSPEEAQLVDRKLDDGMPGMGNITVFCALSCADSTDMSTAQYLVSNEGEKCSLAMSVYE